MPTEWEGTPLLVGLVLIFLMNLPLNTFWYSLVVLALYRSKMLEFTRVPAYVNGALASGDIDLNRRVAVLGETVASEVFKGRDPLGEELLISGQHAAVR